MKAILINWNSLYAILLIASLSITSCGGSNGGQILDSGADVTIVYDYSPSEGGVQQPAQEPEAGDGEELNYPDIEANLQIAGWECKGGKAVSVTIKLDISGGRPPYTTDPELPYHVSPGENIKIEISSSTATGEPRKIVDYTVPKKYDCPSTDPSEVTNPPIDPTDPPIDPTDPPIDPTDPPVDPTDPPIDPTDPPVDPTDPPAPKCTPLPNGKHPPGKDC